MMMMMMLVMSDEEGEKKSGGKFSDCRVHLRFDEKCFLHLLERVNGKKSPRDTTMHRGQLECVVVTVAPFGGWEMKIII